MNTHRAKLFQTGGSQAVRLPKEFRFPDEATEVVVRREGKAVILEPIDEWSPDFLAVLGSLKDEPPFERPKPSKPRNPFE